MPAAVDDSVNPGKVYAVNRAFFVVRLVRTPAILASSPREKRLL